MKHTSNLIALALAGTFAGAAIAADPAPAVGNKADSTKVVPQRSDLQPGAAPTVQSMGENAQRQHDRNAAATPKSPDAAKTPGVTATGATATTSATAAAPAPTGAGQVRDWAAIDKNKDNLISPEEMEEFLKQSSAAAPAPKS